MRITVTRSGGFAGIVRSAALDTRQQPDAAELADLARTALEEGRGAPGPVVPDGFFYEVEIDGEMLQWSDPHLTGAQSALVKKVLGEGSPGGAP